MRDWTLTVVAHTEKRSRFRVLPTSSLLLYTWFVVRFDVSLLQYCLIKSKEKTFMFVSDIILILGEREWKSSLCMSL